jgi:DNA-directed RNA polymerase specialized sigma24 family protein
MAFELQAFGRNRHGGAGMQAERMSDTELVEGIRAGETACYGALVDRHHRRLFRAAHRIVRNEADAEDALQEAYLHSFRRLEQFEGRSAVVTWMTRIAINEAFTCVRQRVPWNSLDAPLAGARNPVDFLAASGTPNNKPSAIRLSPGSGPPWPNCRKIIKTSFD